MSDRTVIETAGLTKRYDDVDALRGLDLRVPSGSIFGFLGRNGAGKTTAIKVLLGMARPTSGAAHVFGLACDGPESVEIRRRTAFVSDDKDLYDYMTVGEMIAFTRSFFPRWRDDLEQRYLRVFELSPSRDIKGLSRGTRTKLALLLALSRGAELLVLDEPTSGLDPAIAEDVLQALVGHVSGEDSTVFFSSHQLAEVEQVADQIAIIDRGQTLVSGALDDLRARYQRIRLVFEGGAPEFKVHAPGTHRVTRKGRVVTILSSSGGSDVLDELRGYRPVSLDVSPVSLKENLLGVGSVLRDAIETQKTFRGFIWYQAFKQNLTQMGVFFAILLGCGSLISETLKGSALFTLSLPVTRRQIVGTRTAVGLAQLAVVMVVPPLAITLLAPSIGQRFSVVDALAHGLCLVVVAALFFSIASFLSTLFSDIWRPLLISIVIACLGVMLAFAAPELSIYRVMSGESYFRTGSLPWTGFLASAVIATALLYSAAETLERRDF